MTEKQQVYYIQLINAFGQKVGVETEENLGFNDRNMILDKIREKKSDLADLLHKFQESYGSLHFVKYDKELRMKMEDIWTIETTRLKAEFNEITDGINQQAKELDIEINNLIEVFK